jgi:hypothetical protein
MRMLKQAVSSECRIEFAITPNSCRRFFSSSLRGQGHSLSLNGSWATLIFGFVFWPLVLIWGLCRRPGQAGDAAMIVVLS